MTAKTPAATKASKAVEKTASSGGPPLVSFRAKTTRAKPIAPVVADEPDLGDQAPRETLLAYVCDDSMRSIEHARKGLPVALVGTLAERLGLKKTGIYTLLGLPRSTIEERISQNAPLSPMASDRIFRALRVFTRAIEVFEDEEAARQWVCQNIRSLGGVSPLSLLDTEPGYELVLRTLGRIEHGVVA